MSINDFTTVFSQMYEANLDTTSLFKLCTRLNKDALYNSIICHIIDMKNKEYTNHIFNLSLRGVLYKSKIIVCMNAMYEGYEGVAMFNMFLLKNNYTLEQNDLRYLQYEISDGNIIEYDGLLHYIYQCGLKVDEEEDEFVKKYLDRWFI